MDNKLNELSKPVAYTDADELRFQHATSDMWPVPLGFGKDVPLYSQEYVSALLAELEAKDAPKDIRIAETEKRLKQRAEEAESRIAELEAIRADASQLFKEISNELGCNPDNESIMMAIDELKATQMTGPLKDVLKRNIELEAKLATPVQLPGFYKDADGNVWLNPVQVVKEIRRSGFTVEGVE